MSVKMATHTTNSDVRGDLRRAMNPPHARLGQLQLQQPISLSLSLSDDVVGVVGVVVVADDDQHDLLADVLLGALYPLLLSRVGRVNPKACRLGCLVVQEMEISCAAASGRGERGEDGKGTSLSGCFKRRSSSVLGTDC
jgi:hypothetical protein